MVLTAAFEFDPRSNKEATIRPTDNIEVPQVPMGGLLCKGSHVCRVLTPPLPPPPAADP